MTELKFDDLTPDAPNLPPHGSSGSFDSLVDDEDKYGGIKGMAASAGLGLMSGATLGLSDVALTKSGLMNPETLQGYQETNPGSHLAGEIGSVFLPGGAAETIGKLGKGVYQGAKAFTGASKLGEIGAHAVGSAVEGALFAGTQQSLNEYALGDPDLNSEKIMANYGHGAILGGVLGGALKTAAVLAPPSIQAAKEGAIGLRNILIGTGEHGDAGLVGKVAPNSKLTEALGQRMTELDLHQQTDLLKKTTDQLNVLHNNTQTAFRDLNENLRPQEINALINTANPQKVMGAVNEIHGALTQAVQTMDANPALFSSNAAAKVRQHIEQLENKMTDWADKPMFEGSDVPSSVFEDLKDIKQSLGNWGHGIMDVTKSDTKTALTDLSRMIGNKLKDPEIFGDVGSRYAAHDEILHDLYQFVGPNGKPTSKLSGLMINVGTKTRPQFEFDSSKIGRMFKQAEQTSGQLKMDSLNQYFDLLNQLPDHLEATYANLPNDVSFSGSELKNMVGSTKEAVQKSGSTYLEAIKNQKGSIGFKDLLAGHIALSHPVLGAVAEGFNLVNSPYAYARSLAETERLIGKVDASITKGAKSVFTPTLKAIGKSKGPLSSEFDQQTIDRHKNLRDELSQLNYNPSYSVEKISAATKDLNQFAPSMAHSLETTLLRANQFLQSKLSPQDQGTPFEQPPDPSRHEIAHFDKYKSLVENPALAFEQIRNHTIGPEAAETLAMVYPKLYQQMKSSLTNEMANKLARKEEIPYQLKQSLSFFFGEPLSRSLSPMAIQANQQAMVASQMQSQMPQGKPNKAGMQKMTIADRTGVERPREKA